MYKYHEDSLTSNTVLMAVSKPIVYSIAWNMLMEIVLEPQRLRASFVGQRHTTASPPITTVLQ